VITFRLLEGVGACAAPGRQIAVAPEHIQYVQPHNDGCMIKVGNERFTLVDSFDAVFDQIITRLAGPDR
jgi:hypothetical protein